MENKYFVRAFGNTLNNDGDPKPYDEAVAELQELYNSCVKGHEEDDYFDEKSLLIGEVDSADSSSARLAEMKVTGNDFYYQYAYILPVNDSSQVSQVDYLLEELNRTSDAISIGAEEYEFRLESMQDVYDEAYHVRELAAGLAKVIQSPEFREKIYQEEAQKRATQQPVDVTVVVEGGMVTDICVSAHAETFIDATVIDLDTTDPTAQEQSEAELNEVREAVQAGLLKSIY